MKEEILSLIRHRLEQAEDSINEAKLLQKEGMSFRSVMNRFYYAMFYSILALLQQKGIGTSKHIGAISLFDKEFIKNGAFDKELSKRLHRAFELRQKSDYLEQTEISEQDIEEMFPKAVDFVNTIKNYLLDVKK
jgi:uncharacterized protein (UPF0332 family)